MGANSPTYRHTPAERKVLSFDDMVHVGGVYLVEFSARFIFGCRSAGNMIVLPALRADLVIG